MPRTKQITMDGATFTIAPLTYSQVEEFMQGANDGTQKGITSNFHVISLALNNADRSAGWTPERIGNEMDLPLIQELSQQVLAFSGLKIETKPGEAKAAQV